MPEDEFLGLLAAVDDFDLVTARRGGGRRDRRAARRAIRWPSTSTSTASTAAAGDAEAVAAEPGALPLHSAPITWPAAVRRAHESDDALTADVLLENLAGKATATLALLRLLADNGIDPASIDYVIGCGEEAIGDRYQRGGGNLAKAVAAAAGCANASGADVKNFCAAPIPALVIASSLVAAGVFQRVAVVAGGSLAKLGMKFQGHLKHDLPVLEDVLGAQRAARRGRRRPLAARAARRRRPPPGGRRVLEPEDHGGPGRSRRSTASAWASTDVDDYATELHNPEITEPQGSGNVPERNYKTIAALAAAPGRHRARATSPTSSPQRGMPGFAPTQGHLASALCYLPHARRPADRWERASGSC